MMVIIACHKKQELPGQLKIKWVEKLEGDFAFAQAWDYPGGVYKNGYGQLSCDGFCPERTDAMKDSTGRIYKDSLSAFYALVDTTHHVHTLQGTAECYEYAGADYMTAQRQQDTVVCYSLCNAATHCSLHLRIIGDNCIPAIQMHSIVPGKNRIYYLKNGTLRIDRTSWQSDSLKADFYMDFGKDSTTGKPISWQGKIYTPVLKK